MATTTIEQPKPANLSLGEIKAAIPKLERRIADLEHFSPDAVLADSTAGAALADKIEHTLRDVFGHDTVEYRQYRVSDLYWGPQFYNRKLSPRELTDGYAEGKARALSSLRTALDMLQEKVSDAIGPGATGAPFTLDGSDLHPALQTACGQKYRDGHYADAVETACKVLNSQVQTKSGKYDVDNTALMENVFSVKSPTLRFNDLKDDTDRDEQLGMMHLYKGACLALRNPRAHKLWDDDAATANGAIKLIDFLIKALEKTKI